MTRDVGHGTTLRAPSNLSGWEPSAEHRKAAPQPPPVAQAAAPTAKPASRPEQAPDQPALFDQPAPVKLTDRQQQAYDLVTAGGRHGVTAARVGAHLCALRGRHPAAGRCDYDSQNGNQMLRALRAKGLVKQRRDGSGVWVATDLPAETSDERYPAYNGPIPF